MRATMTSSVRRSLVCIGLVVGVFGLIARGARADQIPPGWTASHMTVVGYTGLQGRGGAEKLAIKAVNGRWYLYAGQLWTPGLSIVDVTDPANPTNLEYHLPDVEHRGDLVYLTYFNAGVRIFDVKNPRMPKEVAWFIPPTPTKRYGPIPDQLVTETEDVLVDRRGNIYITDKQWGIWIVRQAPGAPARK